MSSRMESRKNRTSIWGTKPRTAPTPATMPSMGTSIADGGISIGTFATDWTNDVLFGEIVPNALGGFLESVGKDWQSEDTVGNNLVDLIGNSQMLNASFLSDSLLNNSVDVSITLVGDDALGVIVHFLLAVCDVLVNVVNQRLVQLQLLLNLVITLEQLDGVPTQEAVINLALDGLFDISDGMLNAAPCVHWQR